MKKFLTFLTVFLMIFMVSTVYADFTGTVDLSSSIEGDLKRGDEFTVIISLKGNATANDYLEFVSTLTYDTDNLELLSPKESISSAGWNVFLYNDTLFAYGSSSEGDIDIISLNFKVKDTIAKTSFVTLSDICVAEGNLVCYFDDLSLSVPIAPEEENPDNNETVEHDTVNNGTVNNGEINNGEINNGEVNNGNVNNGEVNNGKVDNTEVTNEKITNTDVTNEKVNYVEVNHVKVTTNEENHHKVSNSTTSSSFPSNSTSPTNTPQIILQEIIPENSSASTATFQNTLEDSSPSTESVSLLPIYMLFGVIIIIQFVMVLLFLFRKNSTS